MAKKKTKPRYGWSGVCRVEDFALTTPQLESIGLTLGIARGNRVKLKKLREHLEPLLTQCKTWGMQDEGGPSVAERRAALREIHESATGLQTALQRLDSTSHGDLAVGYTTGGFEQFQKDVTAVSRIGKNANQVLTQLPRGTGPRPRTTLPWLVEQLSPIWRQHTGKAYTHSPYRTEKVAPSGKERRAVRLYQSESVTESGRFILAVASCLYSDVKGAALARWINSARTGLTAKRRSVITKKSS